MEFTTLGTKLRIDFSFLLIILLSAILGNNNLLWLVLFSSLHEMGHIVALLIFGGNVDEITVSYYGIGMCHNARLRPIKEIVFLSAGVMINAFFAAFNLHREINTALLLINVLPIYPLDGGRVMNALIELILSADSSYRITKLISLTISAIIFAVAIVFRNISLLMIVLYITFYYINFEVLQ